MHACMHAYMHTYIHTYVHTYIHTHTDIHTYIHIYIYTAWVLYKNALYKNLRGSVPRWAIYFQLYQTHSRLRIWGTLESDCQVLKLLLIRNPLYWRLRAFTASPSGRWDCSAQRNRAQKAKTRVDRRSTRVFAFSPAWRVLLASARRPRGKQPRPKTSVAGTAMQDSGHDRAQRGQNPGITQNRA